MFEFGEDKQGVHFMLGEMTLCGFAFDVDSESDWEHGKLEDTMKTTVTCKECIDVILQCRKVRTYRKKDRK